MNKRVWRKLIRVSRGLRKSFPFGKEKTVLGLWGEGQVKKLQTLGQEVIVMQAN